MTAQQQVRAGEPAGVAVPEERPTDRWLAAAALVLCALIVVDRARMLRTFGFRYTDEDQALLWTTVADLRHLDVWAPYFYGQAYGSWLEALVAVPFSLVGLGFRFALPLAGLVAGAAPPLLLAATAWRRRAHLVALAILAAFLLVTTRGALILGMARGIMPGILLAALGAVVVLNGRSKPKPWAVALFGLLAIGGAGFNESALLVAAPVGAWLALSNWRDVRVWGALAGGAAAGGLFHVLAHRFYDSHPAYAFHPVWKFAFETDLLRAAFRRIGDYVGDYGLEILPVRILPLLVLVVLLALVVRRHRLAGAVAAASVVMILLVALGTPKATDGTRSIFFSYSRVLLALPALLAVLAVLSVRDGTDGSDGGEPGGPKLSPAARRGVAVALVAVGLVGAGYRQVSANRVISRLVREVPNHPVSAAHVDTLLAQCRDTARVARDADTSLVVYRVDRLAAYACGAELDGELTTLFPSYDRRTWLLEREAERPRTSLLVADADQDLCRQATFAVTSCAVVDQRLGLVLVRFDSQPALPLLGFLGVEVRDLS